MTAVVLAAGFGRRLGPLTRRVPKALLPFAGRPLLRIALEKLAASGFDLIAVNAHHHAERVEEFLREGVPDRCRVLLSREEEILGTGGGVRRIAEHLEPEGPVLVHNVDVLCDLPLAALLERHRESGASATLALADRPTSRALAVDAGGRVCGRWGSPLARPAEGGVIPLAFQGIQVIDGVFAARLPGSGSFDLIDAYLEGAAAGEEIAAFRTDGAYWADLGTPERIARAEADLAEGRITLERLLAAKK